MGATKALITRRRFIRTTVGATAIAGLGAELSVRADALETSQADQPLIIDGAVGMLSPVVPKDVVTRFLEQARQGGVSCVLATVATIEDWPTTLERILAYTPFLESHQLTHVTTVQGIEAAHAKRQMAVVFHCGGSYMLGGPYGLPNSMISTFDVSRVGTMYQLGVRVMQLTDNFKGLLGDGCTERTDCELTDYGIWALKTMNDLGIVVDCSHAGYRTSMEAIERSSDPIIFSHSSVNALCPSKRNLKDDQIRAVAAKGGVIGINAFSAFVDPKQPTLERFLDHVDYVAKLVGEEYVGVGFGYAHETARDYARFHRDPSTYPKPPWSYAVKDPSQIPALQQGLRARGYSEKAVAQILGQNFLRVFRKVWKA